MSISLFDPANPIPVINRVERSINAPFVDSQISTLGGAQHASILVRVSLDPKSKWAGGIFHNSRYLFFRIGREGTVENFARWSARSVKKMRTTRVASLTEAISKINRFVQTK